jgi:hypothetical protein
MFDLQKVESYFFKITSFPNCKTMTPPYTFKFTSKAKKPSQEFITSVLLDKSDPEAKIYLI